MKAELPSEVAVVGLGYVGLPLATHFARVLPTLGFDINPKRVQALQQGRDENGEISKESLRLPHLRFSSNPEDLSQADCFVIAVPTPVDKAKRPDLRALTSVSQLIGQALRMRITQNKNGALSPLVIYESTVYPGCTEEVCLPILEQESHLKSGTGFKLGYSPERINPGDTEHTLDKVVKIVSGQDAETLERVATLYSKIVKVGVHRAPDIRTAEAAKVIENVQRDLNIALINELSMLFHRMGIDLREVLKAAGTKWNFLPFQPGLVGGHCIPEDPYYLTYKAQEIGYHPEVILAGRRTNDSMGSFVAQETVKLLIASGHAVQGVRVLVLGVSFKENVRDVRNTKVLSLVRELEGYGSKVAVHDPVVGEEEVRQLGLSWVNDPFGRESAYDAVVLAVPHKIFLTKGEAAFLQLLSNGTRKGVLVDIKAALNRDNVQLSKVSYWTL